MKSFKDTHTAERRLELAARINSKYPDRVPVIIEPNSEKEPQIKDVKYLVPRDTIFSKLMFEARKHMPKCKEHQAITFLINNKMIPITQTVGEVYEREKAEDGLLYVVYCKENNFGSE